MNKIKYDDDMEGCLDDFNAAGICGIGFGDFTIKSDDNIIEVKYNDDNAGGGPCVHPDAYFIIKCNGVEVINDAHIEDSLIDIIIQVIRDVQGEEDV